MVNDVHTGVPESNLTPHRRLDRRANTDVAAGVNRERILRYGGGGQCHTKGCGTQQALHSGHTPCVTPHATFPKANGFTAIWGVGSYAYDADARRVRRNQAGVTTYYFFSQYELQIDVGQPDNEVKCYFAGSQRVAMRSTAEGLAFYHSDHLGSTLVMSGPTGLMIGALAYDPYGSDAVDGIAGLPATLDIAGTIVGGAHEFQARETITSSASLRT